MPVGNPGELPPVGNGADPELYENGPEPEPEPLPDPEPCVGILPDPPAVTVTVT